MLSGILLGSFTQPSSMYKVCDFVTIKTANELKKIALKGIIYNNGFYIKSGLFINSAMFCFCGKSYKIIDVKKNSFCNNGIAYILNIEGQEREWIWDDNCFNTLPVQLELEF